MDVLIASVCSRGEITTKRGEVLGRVSTLVCGYSGVKLRWGIWTVGDRMFASTNLWHGGR